MYRLRQDVERDALAYLRVPEQNPLPDYGDTKTGPLGGIDAEELYARLSKQLAEVQSNMISSVLQEGACTREHVTAEVGLAKTELKATIERSQITIVDCLKFNATKNIRLLCIFAALGCMSSLLVSFVIGVHVVNPILAVILLITALGFYIMTKVHDAPKERR